MTKTTKRSRSEELVTSSEVQQSPSRKNIKWTAEHDRILVNYVKENPFNRQLAFRKTSEETKHSVESCEQRWYKVVSLRENTTAVSLFTFGTKKYFPNRTSYVEGWNKTVPVSPRTRFWNRIKEIFGL